MALFMNADYAVADAAATFQHGNLPRGVSPVGNYSQTPVHALGRAKALHFYLRDELLSAAEARSLGFVHEVSSGVDAAQARAKELAYVLSRQSDLGESILHARLPIPTSLTQAEEAFGHSHCLTRNGGRHLVPGLAAGPPVAAPVVERLTPEECTRSSHGTVRSLFVPEHLDEEAIAEALRATLQPGPALVVRGSGHNLCLGAGPMLTGKALSDEVLESAPHFAQLLAKLQSAARPILTVCHGATRAEGMMFPCAATVVLADTNSSFGFSGTRQGNLSALASVVAQQRLNSRALGRLICTGDAFGVAEAAQLGLVDLVGSHAEVETALADLTARILQLLPSLRRCCKDLHSGMISDYIPSHLTSCSEGGASRVDLRFVHGPEVALLTPGPSDQMSSLQARGCMPIPSKGRAFTAAARVGRHMNLHKQFSSWQLRHRPSVS